MCGISLPEYDDMTPRELTMCVDVYMEREKQDVHKGMHEAWLSAYWHRVETLKPFAEYIEKPKPKIMTAQEMLINVEALNAQFGGTVVTA